MRKFFYRFMTDPDLKYKIMMPIVYAMGVYAVAVNVWLAYRYYTR